MNLGGNDIAMNAFERLLESLVLGSISTGTLATTSSLHRQTSRFIEPLGLLPVDHHGLMVQHDMYTAIAGRAPLVGQLAQLLTQHVFGWNDSAALPIGIDNAARPVLDLS